MTEAATLRVVIRDDSPMWNANSCPTYRSVEIKFTQAQLDRLFLKGSEAISQCFIEFPTCESNPYGM